jgi:hypothetical protein
MESSAYDAADGVASFWNCPAPERRSTVQAGDVPVHASSTRLDVAERTESWSAANKAAAIMKSKKRRTEAIIRGSPEALNTVTGFACHPFPYGDPLGSYGL